MYDWPEIRPSTDRFWQLFRDRLRRRGLSAPDELSRDRSPVEEWLDPALCISQTCGHPYATLLRSRVALVGIPVHEGAGEQPGTYASVLVARREDMAASLTALASRRFAFNERRSQSGFHAPLRLLAAAGIVSDATPMETGAHRASIRAVAAGAADWAAIDRVAWQLALRHESAAAGLAVFATTPPTPALPLIAGLSLSTRTAEIAAAWREALVDLPRADRKAMLLSGFVEASPEDYRPLARPHDIGAVLPALVGTE